MLPFVAACEGVLIDPVTREVAHDTSLDSRTEIAGRAQICEFFAWPSGTPCTVRPILGVPLRWELASPDGRRAFAGEAIQRYDVDNGWDVSTLAPDRRRLNRLVRPNATSESLVRRVGSRARRTGPLRPTVPSSPAPPTP